MPTVTSELLGFAPTVVIVPDGITKSRTAVSRPLSAFMGILFEWLSDVRVSFEGGLPLDWHGGGTFMEGVRVQFIALSIFTPSLSAAKKEEGTRGFLTSSQ